MIQRGLAAGVLGLMMMACAVAEEAKPDAVVTADGSGQFRTVQEAINAAPQLAESSNKAWVISIKPGTYKEHIYIQREKRHIRLVGQDAVKTVLTFDLYAEIPGPDGRPIGTFRTPSTYIDADDFTCENLTFENSAGPKGQALAIRIDGDRVAFYHCRFLGWQDTILGNRGRHYFRDCYIRGAVDFIFGAATEFYDRCEIHCAGKGYITAASTPVEQPFGFVFSHCRITTEPGVKTDLGRPWRAYGSAIFLETEMAGAVNPAGWNNWRDPAREQTARFGEYGSTGPGAQSAARVRWAKRLTAADAEAITIRRVLGGSDGWEPPQAVEASSRTPAKSTTRPAD